MTASPARWRGTVTGRGLYRRSSSGFDRDSTGRWPKIARSRQSRFGDRPPFNLNR